MTAKFLILLFIFFCFLLIANIVQRKKKKQDLIRKMCMKQQMRQDQLNEQKRKWDRMMGREKR